VGAVGGGGGRASYGWCAAWCGRHAVAEAASSCALLGPNSTCSPLQAPPPADLNFLYLSSKFLEFISPDLSRTSLSGEPPPPSTRAAAAVAACAECGASTADLYR
jgi:hypothetical protein